MFRFGDADRLHVGDALRQQHQQLLDGRLVGDRDLADADQVGQQHRQRRLQPVEQWPRLVGGAGPVRRARRPRRHRCVAAASVIVARWAAQAWIASAVSVWESSTGFGLVDQRRQRIQVGAGVDGQLGRPLTIRDSSGPEPAERGVGLVDDGLQVVVRDRLQAAVGGVEQRIDVRRHRGAVARR